MRIFDLWMQCHAQEEIAEICGCSVQPVKDVISDILANLPKNLQSHPAATHLTDFDPPIYNVWKQQIPARVGEASIWNVYIINIPTDPRARG